MKNSILLITIIVGMLLSCRDNSQNNRTLEQPKTTTTDLSKKVFYQTKMNEKGYSLISNGPCDDALDDTMHQRFVAYIESKELRDSTSTIEFKFKDACCQEFMGDYKIDNDTLKFEFEQVNDEQCDCICWYRYKLEISNADERFSEVEIVGKR